MLCCAVWCVVSPPAVVFSRGDSAGSNLGEDKIRFNCEVIGWWPDLESKIIIQSAFKSEIIIRLPRTQA